MEAERLTDEAELVAKRTEAAHSFVVWGRLQQGSRLGRLPSCAATPVASRVSCLQLEGICCTSLLMGKPIVGVVGDEMMMEEMNG